MKSLFVEGKYGETIEFFEENGIIIYKCHRDHCTFYSYKIMGICLLKYTRDIWKEPGYKPSEWMAVGDRSFDTGDYDAAIEAYQKARAVNSDKAWYAMGCAYCAMGNPYESVEAGSEAKAILHAKNFETNPKNALS